MCGTFAQFSCNLWGYFFNWVEVLEPGHSCWKDTWQNKELPLLFATSEQLGTKSHLWVSWGQNNYFSYIPSPIHSQYIYIYLFPTQLHQRDREQLSDCLLEREEAIFVVWAKHILSLFSFPLIISISKRGDFNHHYLHLIWVIESWLVL